jgi:hypothetical protein
LPTAHARLRAAWKGDAFRANISEIAGWNLRAAARRCRVALHVTRERRHAMGHIVISMDSHTELVADLKPYLARKWQDEFKRGEVLAQRYFSSMINSFGAMMTDPARAGQQQFSIRQCVCGPSRRARLKMYFDGQLERYISCILANWWKRERPAAG